MIHPRACIANAKFVYLGSGKGKELKRRLKYLQYRHERGHQRQPRDQRQWVNHGLGDTYAEIDHNCERWATQGYSRNVAARTLVISPHIDWMQALPEAQRQQALQELTEATVATWFDNLGLPAPEYSYVVHQALSADQRPDGTSKDVAGEREFLHTHVVLAATVPGLLDERDDYFVGKRQIRSLHDAASRSMEQVWTRHLGVERVRTLDAELTETVKQLKALDETRLWDGIPQVPDVPLPTHTPAPKAPEQPLDWEL